MLLLLTLLVSSARAQIITDPARAAAARDTLLRQAAQLRQQAEQTSAFFITNAGSRSRRRVVVRGVSRQRSATLPTDGVRQQPWAPDNVAWRHVTRYRRNGRVRERFRLTVDGKKVLRERRFDGALIWLSIPVAYANVMGTAIRHRGLYLSAGYLILDRDQYALPQPLR